MKYIKSYNESIKDFLKPKPMEDILKTIDNSDEENLRSFLSTECIKKFDTDQSFYDFLMKESIINKFILKYRSFKKYGYIPDGFGISDLIDILNKKELIKLAKKLWEKE